MSQTSERLLKAASELLGGDKALAEHLGISEKLLRKFINDRQQLPDCLLLHCVDVILADRDREAAIDKPKPSAPSRASPSD